MNLLPGARERIAAVEAAAADALAPDVELRLDGWRLRYDAAPARRLRSVLPEARGTRPTDEKLRRIDRFYASRGAPARVQLSPVALPTGLDRALAERGWVREEGAYVLWRDLNRPLPDPNAAAGETGSTLLTDGPEAEAALAAVVGVVAPDLAVWSGTRIAALRADGRTVRVFAATRAGEPIGACVTVHEPAARLAGLFQAAVVPDQRGRGTARRLVRAALADARAHGAGGVYLQVSPENRAALRLYEGEAFARLHRYHYRRAPSGPDDGLDRRPLA